MEERDWYYKAPESFVNALEKSRSRIADLEQDLEDSFLSPPQSIWASKDRVRIGNYPFVREGDFTFYATSTVGNVDFDVFRELSEMYAGRHELLEWSRFSRMKFVFEDGQLAQQLEGQLNWVPTDQE